MGMHETRVRGKLKLREGGLTMEALQEAMKPVMQRHGMEVIWTGADLNGAAIVQWGRRGHTEESDCELSADGRLLSLSLNVAATAGTVPDEIEQLAEKLTGALEDVGWLACQDLLSSGSEANFPVLMAKDDEGFRRAGMLYGINLGAAWIQDLVGDDGLRDIEQAALARLALRSEVPGSTR